MYSDAREIAMDIFKSNFYQLSEEAINVALQRVEEFTDKLIRKLQDEQSTLLNSMREPDMQYALYTAQREYARTGDKDLLEILVDILVDRASTKERSLMQIVLNESLEIVPKLTNDQLDILSLVFILKYAKTMNLGNIKDFEYLLLTTVVPFLDSIQKEKAHYQHLEYTGCGAVSVLETKLEDQFQANYPGLFSKRFSLDEFRLLSNGESSLESVLIPFLHINKLFQVSSLEDKDLREICLKNGADDELVKKIEELQTSKIMTPDEIKKMMTNLNPSINTLFEIWSGTSLKIMTLTSVGIALAHANIRKK